MSIIYNDNGAARGLRTRYFRDAPSGVEWIYAVDYAGGSPFTRWHTFGMACYTPDNSIAKLIARGMVLTPLTAVEAA